MGRSNDDDEDRDLGSSPEVAKDGPYKVLSASSKALKVQNVKGVTSWVPISVIHDDSEVYTIKPPNNEGELVLMHWFAAKEGFIS